MKTEKELMEAIEGIAYEPIITPIGEILKMKALEQPFVLDKMIPQGAITALTSDVGKGKSLLMLKMAEAIARGEKLFGEYAVKQMKVLILDLEMSQNDIIRRVKSVVQTPCPLDIVFCEALFIDKDKDWEWLSKAIKENDYGLLVIDTLNSAHSREENSASEMRIVNRKLLDLINKTGVTILYLHHHRKQMKGERYGQSTSRGSTEILAKVASHLLLDSHPVITVEGLSGNKVILEQHKARLPEKLKKIAVNIIYDPIAEKTTFTYQGEMDEEKTAKDRGKELVVQILSDGMKYTRDEIGEKGNSDGVNIGRDTIDKALKELGQIGTTCSSTAQELGVEYGRGTGKAYNTLFYWLKPDFKNQL